MFQTGKRLARALPMMAGWWLVALTATAAEGLALKNCADVTRLLKNIGQFGGAIITAVAVVVFMIAAYFFLFGAGSEDAAKKGKQYLIYGVVGIIVAFIAFSLPGIVTTVTGGSFTCPVG